MDGVVRSFGAGCAGIAQRIAGETDNALDLYHRIGGDHGAMVRTGLSQLDRRMSFISDLVSNGSHFVALHVGIALPVKSTFFF